MRSFRNAGPLLLMTLLAAAPGCRTAGVGDLTRRDTLPAPTARTAAAVLAEHNANAQRVRSVEARPWIKVTSSRSLRAGLDGRLAMERPRNFKLSITGGPLRSEVADIGSNGDEFWFWVKENKDKAVYYCNYDEDGTSPLAAGFQPDWIVEALGLKVFSEDELASIKVQPGRDPATLLLTQRTTPAKGEALVKEAVLSEATHRIKEYRVYSADRKSLLARATVTEYKEFPTTPSEPGGQAATVYLPALFTLEWPQEKMSLDVGLRDVQVNTQFPQARRDLIFVEPKLAGIPRKALAEGARESDGPDTIRQSLPAPPPRARLGEPEPIGVEGARPRPTDPAALAADLPPSRARGVEEVVGPPIPTVADPLPQVVRGRSGWRGATGPLAIER